MTQMKFNNVFMSMSDTHAACMNFVNALEKIPGIIAQYEERTAKLKADVPILEGIMAKTWGKENELKQLKSELAALDRKIAAELAPKQENPNDGEEIKKDYDCTKSTEYSKEDKKTMVAESKKEYSQVSKDLSSSFHSAFYLRGRF